MNWAQAELKKAFLTNFVGWFFLSELIDEAYMHASAVYKQNIPGINEKYKEWKKSVESSLDPKTVELISIAVGSALQCAYCVESHAQKAKAKGVTEKEISEAVAVAAGISAGATVSYGILALKEQ